MKEKKESTDVSIFDCCLVRKCQRLSWEMNDSWKLFLYIYESFIDPGLTPIDGEVVPEMTGINLGTTLLSLDTSSD